MKFKNFKKTDKYDQRKCGHIYHKDCDDAKIINCPICRE